MAVGGVLCGLALVGAIEPPMFAQKPGTAPQLKTQIQSPAQAPARQKGRAPIASGCGAPIVLGDKSFQRLEGGSLRDAAVWVDDIDSGIVSGYQPFELYVVTGRAYAPFQLQRGALNRDAFFRLTSGNYNIVRQAPVSVSAQNATSAQLAFEQDGHLYKLRVLGVQPSTFNRDTVTLQLCW